MRNKINDKLKHSILFELKGRSRGGWDALVQYLPEANKFILLEGSKLASECAMSCSDKLYGLLIAHQKAGNISPDPERKVLKNMTFTSASTVANLVALAQIGIHNYIAKGTTISLENMLANDELYNKVIDVQELNKVKELEDKENSQNIEEDIEKEMGKYDIKHSVTLHLYSDADSGRGYDARIKFNSITGNFIILRESRMALQPVPSCPETYINRAIELFKTGKVTKEGVILTDIAYTTLGAAGSLIALSVAFEDNIYIDGTDFKLIDVLDDVILYKELIIRE